MGIALKPLTAAIAAAAMLAVSLGAAEAKCTRLAFSVNDYGKKGPTDDAKALLDKYIAKWMADRKIAKYTTGKKDVTCDLFLDFGFFDEYTCKAAATVCWDGETPAGADITTSSTTPAKAAAPKKKAPAAKAAAPASEPVKAPAKAAPTPALAPMPEKKS